MWAHYAEKHSGVCLGFDVDKRFANKVTYTRKRLSPELGAHLQNHGINEPLLRAVVTTKGTEWRYEREYRPVQQLQNAEDGIYFLEFDDRIQVTRDRHRASLFVDRA